MTTQGLRLFMFLGCTLGFYGGCASVPPAPAQVNARPPAATTVSGGGYADDEGSGWLFDRLTGRKRAESGRDAAAGVVPASATEPAESLPPVSATPALAARESDDDDDDGFDWSDLEPENIVKNIKKATGYGPIEGVARAHMKDGKELFEQERYSEAASKFKAAAGRWPDSTLEEDALFMLGQCYVFTDQYPKAQDAYDNLLKKYSNSRHLDTVVKHLFTIGRYWENLYESDPQWATRITPNLTNRERPLFDIFGNAMKAYESVWTNDPTGPLADDAMMATANAFFRKGRFEDAAQYYDMLREQFPKSEHQARAHLLGLQSKLQVYQGEKYDRTPLDEADKIAGRTLTQFRDELGPEHARLVETRDRIAEEKAKRDWAMAQYYDRKKQYGAARYYYLAVIEDFPLSQYTPQANARLEAISSEPNNPPNRFKWLTDMFPVEE